MDKENGRLLEVKDWLRKAKHDIRAAEHLLTIADPPTDVICFHSQQCAEKCLKAFLVYNQIIPIAKVRRPYANK